MGHEARKSEPDSEHLTLELLSRWEPQKVSEQGTGGGRALRIKCYYLSTCNSSQNLPLPGREGRRWSCFHSEERFPLSGPGPLSFRHSLGQTSMGLTLPQPLSGRLLFRDNLPFTITSTKLYETTMKCKGHCLRGMKTLQPSDHETAWVCWAQVRSICCFTQQLSIFPALITPQSRCQDVGIWNLEGAHFLRGQGHSQTGTTV